MLLCKVFFQGSLSAEKNHPFPISRAAYKTQNLFDEHLCSILIVNCCQESRLTGTWSLACLLPSSSDDFSCLSLSLHFFLTPLCIFFHLCFFLSILVLLTRRCTFYTVCFQGLLLYWEQWRDKSGLACLLAAVSHSLLCELLGSWLGLPAAWAPRGKESTHQGTLLSFFFSVGGLTGSENDLHDDNLPQDSGVD